MYRRDQPQLAKGRYREFTQCDFDLAGKHVPMGAEAEVLQVRAASPPFLHAMLLQHTLVLRSLDMIRLGLDYPKTGVFCALIYVHAYIFPCLPFMRIFTLTTLPVSVPPYLIVCFLPDSSSCC